MISGIVILIGIFFIILALLPSSNNIDSSGMLGFGIVVFLIGLILNKWHKKRIEKGKMTFEDAVNGAIDGTVDAIGETIVETARDKRRKRRNKESSADKFLREYEESSAKEMSKYRERQALLEQAAQLERDAKFHPSARKRLLYEAQELRRKADKI